jgi:sugar transferase (PEP-CTERM/EpsH1 system associated)
VNLKILLLLPRPLIPADIGGKIRSLNIFKRLAKRMEIHAMSLADLDREGEGIVAMRDLFGSYTPLPWRETSKGSPAFFRELLANRFSDLPYSVAKYKLRDVRKAVEARAAAEHFDLVFCDFLPMAAALLESNLKPRVIFEHNVEFVLRKRLWSAETHPIKKWVFKAEWERTYAMEKKVCRAFDFVLAVSEEDKRTFESEFGIDHVSSMPTGVDTEFFKPQETQPRKGHLVFVGSMDWYPNEDGVLWFLQEVYPQIRAQSSGVTFTIVGRNPTARLRKAVAGDDSVELTGRVDDVRPYTASAEVVLVPLRVGGGTRIKIPEAMAMAKPIVSTTLGAEGLGLQTGREILLADETGRFAEAVLKLLNDPALRVSLASSARESVVRGNSWDRVTDNIERTLERVAGVAHSAARAEAPVSPAIAAERTSK